VTATVWRYCGMPCRYIGGFRSGAVVAPSVAVTFTVPTVHRLSGVARRTLKNSFLEGAVVTGVPLKLIVTLPSGKPQPPSKKGAPPP
jgi:hypothetical protein